MIAARTLANNCQYFHVTRDVDVWKAVDAYNLGQGGAQAYFNANGRVSAYAEKVRKAVNSDPGYLAQIQQADQTNAQQNKANMYTNPFPDGWEPNRLDMGYDGTFRRRIVAPFSGTITFAGLLTGWKGSHGVVIKCDHNIALQSKSLYFYEGVKPNVQAGDKVKTGAVIALPMKNPYNGVMGNIEWGVAQDRAVGQQSDAYVMHTSQNRKDVVLGFLDWAQNVLKVPGKPTSTSGAGYP
jgi:hypothetical protein